MDKDYKVLNLGCGEDMFGSHRIDCFKTNATTEVANLEEGLPYPDKFFDEVYCRSVLEHIKNLGIFIDEIYRVLKPKGKLYVRTDHAGFLLAYLLDRHESNRAIDDQYQNGYGFGHVKRAGDFEDHHYHLFVASHLKYLFGKFNEHQFIYIKKGSKWWKTLFYNLLPRNMGAYHIDMICWK